MEAEEVLEQGVLLTASHPCAHSSKVRSMPLFPHGGCALFYEVPWNAVRACSSATASWAFLYHDACNQIDRIIWWAVRVLDLGTVS